MPRKKKNPEATPHVQDVEQGRYWCLPTAEWGGFFNVRLDDADVEVFNTWFEEHTTDFWVMLEDLMGEGMKVGVAYDRENEAFVVSFTGRLVAAFDLRCCTTSRAGTLGVALSLACWKHVYLAGGDYGNFMPKTGKFMSFG